MLAFNSTPFPDGQFNRIYPKIPELQQVSFQHDKQVLQNIDANFPIFMQKSLIIIITVLGTLFFIILSGTIYYFK